MANDKKELSKEEEEALREEIAELEEELGSKDPDAKIKEHIKLLHEYNELKDATQMMIGKIADIKGTTLRELHDQYGLTSDD